MPPPSDLRAPAWTCHVADRRCMKALKLEDAGDRRRPAAPRTGGNQAAVTTAAAALGFMRLCCFGVTGRKADRGPPVPVADIGAAAAARRWVLVPEINLTPQLEARVAAPSPMPASSATPPDRRRPLARLRLQRGCGADIVPRHRLAVSPPDLAGRDHHRRRARPLRPARRRALFGARRGLRAHERKVPMVLGSATPSLEATPAASESAVVTVADAGRAWRPGIGCPRCSRVDLVQTEKASPASLLEAIEKRLGARAELVFSTAAGYAPVFRLHRLRLDLQLQALVPPTSCCTWPTSAALPPLRLRKPRPEKLPHLWQPGHPPLRSRHPAAGRIPHRTLPRRRILRADRDVAKSRKQWEALVEKIHAGEADIPSARNAGQGTTSPADSGRRRRRRRGAVRRRLPGAGAACSSN